MCYEQVLSSPSTFGTPGVKENCFFLKEIPGAVQFCLAVVFSIRLCSITYMTTTDTVRVRERLLDVLETANIPGYLFLHTHIPSLKLCFSTSEADRKKMLSFVVVGGGPTGVEFAAELHGM